MRDQKQTSAGSLELQRCHCASVWPFQQEWLFGAGGLRAAFLLPYETNLTVTRRSPGIHCCCEISSTKESTTTINPPAATQPVTSLVSVLIVTPLPGVTGCLHGVSIVIHIPVYWNAPMTLLCGHFSLRFSPQQQNDRMTSASLSGPQELNELCVICFLAIDLKSKSATLLVCKNFPGNEVAAFCFHVGAVVGPCRFSPYLPTIPVSPH